MKSLLPLTREAKNSLFFAPIVLVEMEYRTSTGALRTLYMANKQYMDSNGRTYINILARREGVSDISYSIGNFGGVASVSEAVITLVNTTSDPNIALSDLLSNYTLSNQNVRIMYVLQPSTEKIGIFSGKIQNVSTALSTMRITANSNLLTDFVDVPSKLFDFAEYPNVPFTNLSQPVPIAFGILNDDANGFIAPLRLYDFFTSSYISGEKMDVYGGIYLWPDGAQSFITVPTNYYNLVDSGRLIERLNPPSSRNRRSVLGTTESGNDISITASRTELIVSDDARFLTTNLPSNAQRITRVFASGDFNISGGNFDQDQSYISIGGSLAITLGGVTIQDINFNYYLEHENSDGSGDILDEGVNISHGSVLPSGTTFSVSGWNYYPGDTLEDQQEDHCSFSMSAMVDIPVNDIVLVFSVDPSNRFTNIRLSSDGFGLGNGITVSVDYRQPGFAEGTFFQAVEGYGTYLQIIGTVVLLILLVIY